MKSLLRQSTLAAMLLLPVALSIPGTSSAQVASRTPVVNALQMSSDNGFAPGAQLNLTVQGTPYGRVHVRVGDGGPMVTLAETSPGVYQGIHTVTPNDRFDAKGLLRANMTTGALSTNANYTFPPSFIAWQNNPQPMRPPVPMAQRMDQYPNMPPPQRMEVMGASGGQIPLDISSHRGSGGSWTQFKGLTAPNARLRIRIDAIPPVNYERQGFVQQVLQDFFRADRDGNFTYNFNPRYAPMPGMRYEVIITADDGYSSNEQRMIINAS